MLTLQSTGSPIVYDGEKIRETMKASCPHGNQAPMNDTTLDLRQQDPNLDRALNPLGRGDAA